MSLSKALKLISPSQLTNIVRFLGDDSHIMIISLLNEGLDKNESLEKLFTPDPNPSANGLIIMTKEEAENFVEPPDGADLDVKALKNGKFEISIGYGWGTIGDGGSWVVEFEGDEVKSCEMTGMWIS